MRFELDRKIYKNKPIPPKRTLTSTLAFLLDSMEIGDMIYANEREVRALRTLAYNRDHRSVLKGGPPFRIATRKTDEPNGDKNFMVWRTH